MVDLGIKVGLGLMQCDISVGITAKIDNGIIVWFGVGLYIHICLPDGFM